MNINYCIKYDNIQLRPLIDSDVEKLRIWRNDPSNNIFLKDIGTISKEKQSIWYQNYLKDKNDITFAIVENKFLDRLVGSLSLYNIIDQNAEFGHMLIGDKDAHGLDIGKKSLTMLMKFAFETLKLNSVQGFVNKDNLSALITYNTVGFLIVGERKSESLVGGIDFEIQLDYNRFQQNNAFLKEIIIESI